MITSPVTGLLKMMYSFSTGVKNQAGETRPLTRFRFPRYFDDMEEMGPYDPVLSHAQAALYQCSNGYLGNEVILFAMDISGFTDGAREHRFKERILICTEKRLLYV